MKLNSGESKVTPCDCGGVATYTRWDWGTKITKRCECEVVTTYYKDGLMVRPANRGTNIAVKA